MLVMNYDVKYKSIAVLTPYGAQKNLVADMIKNDPVLKTDWKSLRVATIVESQGTYIVHDFFVSANVFLR